MRLIGSDREAWRRATPRQRLVGLALGLLISLPMVLLLIVLALLLASRL
jgi:tetrahydromethanopterin S-methyltransferase subunit F